LLHDVTIAQFEQSCANLAKHILRYGVYINNGLKMAVESKQRLVFIKCECGQQILLIPSVNAMSLAIENHALKHASIKNDPMEAQLEVERIKDLLIKQVFERAAKA